MEIHKANYFVDKNKSKYFTNVSASLTDLMRSMEGEFGPSEQNKFRTVLHELIDVSS